MTRLIAFIATLLLGAAAGAHVPRASVTASHGLDAVEQIVGIEHTGIESAAAELHFLETACTAKTARPARARLDASESACASVLTHCGVLEKWSSAEKWASAKRVDSYPNEQPTAGLPVFVFNLRFPGQHYDRETGTHYNYFRDYEPGTGRYVQSDPIGLNGGLNTFAYVGGSPLDSVDPYGLARKGSGKGEDGCDVCGSATSRKCSCSLTVLEMKPLEDLLYGPSQRGSAPYGMDNEPIELHHLDQETDDVIEMTREEHRGGDNFSANHANTGQDESKINERRFNRLKRRKWCEDFDSGRFEGLPTKPE